MLEGDNGLQSQIISEQSSFVSFSLSSLKDLLSTPEGKAIFRQRIEDGFETYARVVRDELPVEQRPEFQLDASRWHKIY